MTLEDYFEMTRRLLESNYLIFDRKNERMIFTQQTWFFTFQKNQIIFNSVHVHIITGKVQMGNGSIKTEKNIGGIY